MKLTGVYTTAGALLSAKILAGSCDLQLTRAVAGSDILEQPQQTLALGTLTRKGTTVTVTATLFSAQAENSYTLTQVGLYALDEDGSEILYRIYTIDQDILVSPACSLTAVFYLSDTVLATTTATVEITSAGVMLQADGESMIRSLHFYDADGSETISCAAAELSVILAQLPKIIDHDITINVSGTTLEDNLILEDFHGPGSLYIKAGSSLAVGGYITVRRCSLHVIELVNIQHDGKTLLNVGASTGHAAAVSVIDCSGLVRITNCRIPANGTKNQTGFYISRSQVELNHIEAPNRAYSCHITDHARVYLRSIVTGTFAKNSGYAFRIEEGSFVTTAKESNSTDYGTSYMFEMITGGMFLMHGNVRSSSTYGSI